MKLVVLAVGKLRDPWVLAGCAEYEKRLRPRLPVEVIEVKDEEQLLKKLPPRYLIWVLDERGEQPSSRELSQRLDRAFHSGAPGLALCIGGADGHSAVLRDRASYLLGLSKLTLPHRLARLLVLEQIYRAQSILDGSPYHRE
ncbi:MAG TPA: 23S rRNA (pseudouridine(1915)-N(3))-methyltransferase RlmH [Pseudomonadota bacterium]|nr:23S rRNA (pseudouridine(1915)-N(3))-methyltransferase RlmH [Pseudomonadota bacterium]HND13090.1 23S rRNA (pseudouridine(1915)-N(3))-methyltransferase RlmH [Pseudomonadota bacterium]HNI61021.1 23S rRNA (pseudouridine(1915)-N(3))-methyltransferase RlmH [Pseudomonadota bacterium]HNK43403.1 23S rRNA (pseudouridine(1915)-N(3))-methyltransferase RlmH [Pseudomonadota bacterium]